MGLLSLRPPGRSCRRRSWPRSTCRAVTGCSPSPWTTTTAGTWWRPTWALQLVTPTGERGAAPAVAPGRCRVLAARARDVDGHLDRRQPSGAVDLPGPADAAAGDAARAGAGQRRPLDPAGARRAAHGTRRHTPGPGHRRAGRRRWSWPDGCGPTTPRCGARWRRRWPTCATRWACRRGEGLTGGDTATARRAVGSGPCRRGSTPPGSPRHADGDVGRCPRTQAAPASGATWHRFLGGAVPLLQLRPPHSPVAQLAEQPTVNRQVTGSSPVGGATFPQSAASPCEPVDLVRDR